MDGTVNKNQTARNQPASWHDTHKCAKHDILIHVFRCPQRVCSTQCCNINSINIEIGKKGFENAWLQVCNGVGFCVCLISGRNTIVDNAYGKTNLNFWVWINATWRARRRAKQCKCKKWEGVAHRLPLQKGRKRKKWIKDEEMEKTKKEPERKQKIKTNQLWSLDFSPKENNNLKR